MLCLVLCVAAAVVQTIAAAGLLPGGALMSPHEAADGVSAGHTMGGQTVRPSLVVMFADNLGYGDVGALGAPSTRTPNVDSLVSHSSWTPTHWDVDRVSAGHGPRQPDGVCIPHLCGSHST